MEYKCKICGFKTLSSSGFGIHLRKEHDLNTKDYNKRFANNFISKSYVFNKILQRNQDIKNYIILTDDITNLKQKIKLHCKKCNHEWETRIPVLYRSSCPSCKKQLTPTIDEFKQKILNLYDSKIECVSESYVNNKTSLDFKCTVCNYQFKYRPDKMLQGKVVCQECKKNKHDSSILKIAQNKNLTIIEYPKNYDNTSKIMMSCNVCNKQWETTLFSFRNNNGCKFCNKYISKGEIEISEWLTSIGIEHTRNKRITFDGINREIDIFIPKHKLAIDFHGLYWHSSLYKEKNYHKDKYDFINKNLGYQYIQIWENEWIFKKNIVKSIIINKLKLSTKKIFARKCEIREINTKIASDFFYNNHIHGFVGGKIKLGLFYENQLVSSIIIGKSRYNNGFEIIRFASALDTSIIGGFSKLLKCAIDKYNINILESFVELRYFDGSGYIKNNFTVSSITPPSYYYFKNNNLAKLYHRSTFQKHKLRKILTNFDEILTEYENMKNNGYLQIYDCGTLKMILKTKQY